MVEQNQDSLAEGKAISEKSVFQLIKHCKTEIQDKNKDKVDKIIGKGLSTNDFTNEDKNKLNGIEDNAEASIIKSISVDGVPQTVVDKNVNIIINNYSTTSNEDVDKLWEQSTRLASGNWVKKNWELDPGPGQFIGSYFWTDGDDIYYSKSSKSFRLNESLGYHMWEEVHWNGPLNEIYGSYVWTDGDDIYYSFHEHYVLDKATSTWIPKEWKGLTSSQLNELYGDQIWSDGENIYYSNHYVLDKSTSTWNSKSWKGFDYSYNFYASSIWIDGENIYYSGAAGQYVLDKATSTWVPIEWNYPEDWTEGQISGICIWTDGNNFYHTRKGSHLVLNKTTNTWEEKEWTYPRWSDFPSMDGDKIWTYKGKVYYSDYYERVKSGTAGVKEWINAQYELYDLNSHVGYEWESTYWEIKYLCNFNGHDIWQTKEGKKVYTIDKILNEDTDLWKLAYCSSDIRKSLYFNGDAIWKTKNGVYYSNGNQQYAINLYSDNSLDFTLKSWNNLNPFLGEYIWTDGENIYYSSSNSQYVLDESTSTWNKKLWNGVASFNGNYIWTDGENIYYSYQQYQYILDKTTSTWNYKFWKNLTVFNGDQIWTDGYNIYYSKSDKQYVLNKATSTWNEKIWGNTYPELGKNIWTDGVNIYYSQGYDKQYILDI